MLVIYIGLAPGLTLRAMDPTLGRVLDEFRRPGAVAAVTEPCGRRYRPRHPHGGPGPTPAAR